MRHLYRYCVVGLAGILVVVGLLLAASHFGTQSSVEKPTEPPPPPVVLAGDGPLPDNAQMEQLAREDPIAFLENCLRRYQREIKGYSCTLKKQERVDDKEQDPEVIEVHFKDQPHSVYFRWLEGARKAERVLYVEGENDGKMLARPKGFLARKIVGDVVERDVDSPDARHSGRSTLDRFGMKKGTERTLRAWKTAREKGKLQVEYQGEVPCEEAGGRLCWKLHFHTDTPQEKEAATDLTIYVDRDNWLQIGSVMSADGKLIGSYYFCDVELNPEFKPEQFQRSALIPAD